MKAKDIRKGTVVMYKGAPHRVLNFQHRTPGNLRAFVQATLRNVITGVQGDTRFSSTEDLETADIFSSKATYLYGDGNGYHFMDTQSYEEMVLPAELIGDSKYYLQDSMEVQISIYNEQPIGVDLPKTVVLTITETSPEMKGATASNSPKPATLDTGLVVSVPPFLKVGERVVVDTDTAEYLSRAD